VNALDFYLASCDGVSGVIVTGEYATYGAIMNYTSRLDASSDCHTYFNTAARSYAATACSTAFDHVAAYVQTADNGNVTVMGGAMTTPYSCLGANSTSCPAECQADLNLLAAVCHHEDLIKWDGNGLDGFLNSTGAPAGTTLSSHDAWALFFNGTAPVPVNLAAGVASAMPLPLDLSACTLPVDATPWRLQQLQPAAP
jgi:hypothetical protein